MYVDMFAGTRFLVEKTLPCSCPRHVSRVTQHVTSVGARYRGGDRRGKKQEVDYKQHRATVVLLRGVGWERRLGVWINDVIVFVQLEPSAAISRPMRHIPRLPCSPAVPRTLPPQNAFEAITIEADTEV